MKLYNTLTRKVEEFKPLKKGEVGIYSCGPTVYWNQHIGHMYAYVQWDTMVRLFRYLGFKVKWVMNITDVGHLTSDEDAGEDKMEVGAKREGLTVWQIAGKYTNQFLESMDLLNIQRPDVLCRATEHLQEQIDLVKKIEARGFTYKTKTGLVFDTSKFADYAQFAKLDLEKQQAGARVEIDPEKKKPWDFLLWVTNQPQHVMQWESPWGKGFPGWHVECTAMSTKYLGEKFDIHTGGKEHIPVHHTNEIAQAYGAFGGRTANYWLHNGWLELKDEKMSKSLGNVILATDIAAKGYDPLALRYLILTSHYRQGLKFTWEALKSAAVSLDKLRELVTSWRTDRGRKTMTEEDERKREEFKKKFMEAVSQDLNFPQGLAVIWQIAKSSLSSQEKLDLVLDFDQVLGFRLAAQTKVKIKIPEKVKQLVEERENLRQAKKWQEADKIRKEIEDQGYSLEDTSEGPKIKRFD
jgi:cysteinyl-tRNA synthetase